MTRAALELSKIMNILREHAVPESVLRLIDQLYKDTYKEAYYDGQVDAEEAHEETWVEITRVDLSDEGLEDD
jgi:hypothetical protein